MRRLATVAAIVVAALFFSACTTGLRTPYGTFDGAVGSGKCGAASAPQPSRVP